MDNEIKIVASLDSGSSEKSLNSLKQRVSDLNNELSTLDMTSIDYKKKLAELGSATLEYNKANEQVISSSQSLTDKLGAVAGMTGALAGAMGAFKGIAALTGKENEQLVTTLTKIQTAIAASAAFENFGKSIKSVTIAFRALNTTMLANPAVAIAAAVAALAAGLLYLLKVTVDSVDKTQEYQKAQDDLNASINEGIKLADDEARVMKAQGRTYEEIANYKINAIKLEIEQRKAAIERIKTEREAEQKSYQDRLETAQKWARIMIKVSQMGLTPIAYLIDAITGSDIVGWFDSMIDKGVEFAADLVGSKDNLDKLSEIETSNLEEIAKAEERLESVTFDLKIHNIEQETALRKKALEDYAKEQRALMEEQSKYQQFLNEQAYKNSSAEKQLDIDKHRLLNLDAEISKLKDIEKTSEGYKRLLDLEKERLTVLELINTKETEQSNNEQKLSELEAYLTEYKEMQLLTEDEIELRKLETYDAEVSRIEALLSADSISLEERIRLQEEYNTNYVALCNQRIKVDGILESQRVAMDKAEADRLAKEKERLKSKYEATRDSVLNIASVLELSQKTAKAAAVAQKAVDITQAGISTYKAANVALASAPPPYNFVLMGTTIAAGLANVYKIASAKIDGDNSAASVDMSVPSIDAKMEAPTETHNNMTESDVVNTRQDSRVYILQSDLDASGNRTKMVNNYTTV